MLGDDKFFNHLFANLLKFIYKLLILNKKYKFLIGYCNFKRCTHKAQYFCLMELFMARLTVHTPDTAPEKAKERMQAVQKANGFIPNLIGVLANSPNALAFYQEVGKMNSSNSLTAEEVEVVQITAAAHNGCDFCVAGHTKIGTLRLKMPNDVLEALRNRTNIDSNEKYQALAQFTMQLIDKRGAVSDEELAAFKAAGYNDQNVLDVVMGVALATLCNYANNVGKTDINPELVDYAPKHG